MEYLLQEKICAVIFGTIESQIYKVLNKKDSLTSSGN